MPMLKVWATLMLISACLAGCATNDGNLCDGWKPIIVSESDMKTMSDSTKRQILSHNEFGEKRCGWKPFN